MSKTYCTYRIRVANHERVQVDKWNSQHQPLGEPQGAFRYDEKLSELAPLLDKAQDGSLQGSDKVRQLGETLFDVLFDDVLCRDFVGFYEQVVHRDRQLLRIELVIDEQGMPEVAALPWEFMCLPTRGNLGTVWLSTAPEVVFSRRRAQYFAAQPIQLKKGEKLRIALVVASPPDLPEISYQTIHKALKQLERDKPDLIELLPVIEDANPETIDNVFSQTPHIVHFLGHCGLENNQGQEVGVFLVDPDLNQKMWVEAAYFSGLLNRHRPGLVILQASHSGSLSSSQAFAGVASRVLQQNIPVIVAMQYEVSDVVSSKFPRHFYEKLAEGDPVDIAAQYGRYAIALGSARYQKRDFATPVIFMRIEDGYLFEQYKEEPLPPPTSVELRRRLEAAMPQQCQVNIPTEVRVMVALHDSPGLRAELPDYTKSGELIEKNDVVQNEVPLEFPVNLRTQEPLPINVFVSLTAPSFKIEQSAKSIRVSPGYDSGIITFFLTPTISVQYSRVIVEWFGDEQKNFLLGSLTLITEVFASENGFEKISWNVEDRRFDVGLSEIPKITIKPLERGEVIGAEVGSISSGDFTVTMDVKQSGQLNVGTVKGIRIGDVFDDIQVDEDVSLNNKNEQPRTPNANPVDGYPSESYESDLSCEPDFSPHLDIFEFAVVTIAENIIYRHLQTSRYIIENLNLSDRRIPLLMSLIPAGAFLMGNLEAGIYGSRNEKPQHESMIQPFLISRYPITQAQWMAVSGFPIINRDLNLTPSSFQGDELPVEQISWLDAVEFCDRLSHHTGRLYRLPTEAEWEYACRAGTSTAFHFGETITTDLANYQGTEAFADGPTGEYRQTTTPVDHFGIANAFGLSDMHGNVWEWCLDHWHDSYEEAPTDGSAWLSETEDVPRVIRGGSWGDPPENCRSASRRRGAANYRSSNIGFRVVCSIPTPEN